MTFQTETLKAMQQKLKHRGLHMSGTPTHRSSNNVLAKMVTVQERCLRRLVALEAKVAALEKQK